MAGGAVKNLKTARERMTGTKPRVFRPDGGAARVYSKLYPLYRRLHDAFGTPTHAGEMSRLMKELIAIRDRARKG